VPTRPTDAVAAHARFVLLRDLPMLVVDLEPATDPGDASGDTDADVSTHAAATGPSDPPDGTAVLIQALAERGMVQLPRFYDVDLPRGVRVGLTIDEDGMRLEDDDETTLLRLPRAGVDQSWIDRALALRGTMLCAGSAIGIGPDQTPHEVCDLLDIAATAGRVLGAIAGVAEPRQGLPLLF
jgi:hypothetical protein